MNKKNSSNRQKKVEFEGAREGKHEDEANGDPVYLLRHPHSERGAAGERIEQRA